VVNRFLGSTIKHGCAVFDEVASYIDCGVNTHVNDIGEGNFTIEAWIKNNNTGLGHQSIVVKNTIGLGKWGFDLVSGTTLRFHGNNTQYTTQFTGLNDNSWHHVVVVRTGTNLIFYCDLVTQTISIGGNTVSLNSLSNMFIGARVPIEGNRVWKGSIDEVRIWNYARTATQIRDNYKRSIQPEAGLIAYYKLDGNTLDSSGNGNHGTVSGNVAWSVDGKVDTVTKVAEFSGTSSINTNIGGNTTPAFSMESWCKPSYTGANYQYIMSKGGTGLDIETGTSLRFILVNTGLETKVTRIAIPASQRNRWYHLVGTFDGTDLRLYLDGSLVHTVNSATPAYVYTNNIFLGDRDSRNNPYSGRIGLSRYWNRALTQQEIQANMFRVLPASTPNLIEQWTLNGDTTGTKGNNGTATNVTYVPDAPRSIADVSTALEKTKLLTSKFKLGSAVFDGTWTTASSTARGIQLPALHKNFTEITLEAWCRLDTSVSRTRGVVSTMQHSPVAQGIGFCVMTGGQVLVHHGDGVNPNGFYLYIYTAIPNYAQGRWHHIAVTYRNSTIQVYVDGVSRSTTSSRPVAFGDNAAQIGKMLSSYWDYVHEGGISDVRIWNYARSATQIAENYKRVLQPQAGLVAYYRLNGNALDSSGNGHHGTENIGMGYSVDGYVPVTSVAGILDESKYITCPFRPLSVTRTTFSYEAWGYVDEIKQSISPNPHQLLTAVNQSGNYLSFSRNGTIDQPFCSLRVVDSQTQVASQRVLYGTLRAPAKKWAHICMTFDGTTITLYVNGMVSGTMAASGFVEATMATTVIGVFNGQGTINNGLYGKAALVRFWSKALTQAEVLSNMYKVLPASTTGLMEQWVLNGDTNATVSSANNGTVVGSNVFVPDTPKGSADVSSAVDKSAILVSKSKQPYALEYYRNNNEYLETDIYPATHLASGNFTFMAWVRPTKTVGDFLRCIIGTRTDGVNNYIGLYVGIANQLYLSTPFGNCDSGANTVPNDTWSFVACTMNNVTRKVAVFVNGVKVIEGGINQVNTSNFVTPIWIGRYGSVSYPYEGIIKDAAIYDTALSDADIAATFTRKQFIINESLLYATKFERTSIQGYGKLPNVKVIGNNLKLLPSTAPVGQRSGLRFDGTSTQISTSLLSGRSMSTQPITVMGWVRPTGAYSVVFTTRTGSNQRFYLGIPFGSTNWDIGVQDKPWAVLSDNKLKVIYGKWVHFAVVATGTDVILYLDNVEAKRVAYTPYTLSANMTIGNIVDFSNDAFFKGTISNISIWNTALTQADIQKNMYSYLPATTPNLVEQWRLNEGVGNIAYGDKGNHGTITGTATWTTPSLMNWRNKVARLDTTNSNYIDLTRILPTLTKQVTSTATFEFWVKPSKSHLASAGVGAPIIQFNSAGTGTTPPQQFGIWYGDIAGSIVDEVISIALFKNFTSAYLLKGFRNSSDIYVNNWFHVAVVLTPTAWTCYINGVQITLTSSAGNISEGGCLEDISSTLVNGFLGQRNISTHKFEGAIDEVRLWNVARTATEIADNYQRSLSRHPNLVLNYTFDSELTFDSSGNNNHGTIVGTVANEDSDNDKLLFNAPIN
jgi:hypothetical protein